MATIDQNYQNSSRAEIPMPPGRNRNPTFWMTAVLGVILAILVLPALAILIGRSFSITNPDASFGGFTPSRPGEDNS